MASGGASGVRVHQFHAKIVPIDFCDLCMPLADGFERRLLAARVALLPDLYFARRALVVRGGRGAVQSVRGQEEVRVHLQPPAAVAVRDLGKHKERIKK